MAQLVKVRYYDLNSTEASGRQYTYFSEEVLKLNDIVSVPVGDGGSARALVSTIDVPETEIAVFRDKVMTIPAGSVLKEALRKVDLNTGEVLETDPGAGKDPGPYGTVGWWESDEEWAKPWSEDDEVVLETTAEPEEGYKEMTTALVDIAPGRNPVIQQHAAEVLKIQRYAQRLVVGDHEADKMATNDLTMIKGLRETLEELQKKWLEPLTVYQKDIRKAFALLLMPLTVADKTLRDKILAYRQNEQRKQQEAEELSERTRQLNADKIRHAQEQGESFVELEPVVEPEEYPISTKTVRAEMGTTSTISIWKWRYKNGLSQKQILEGLPLQFHMVNETMIGQMVRGKNKNQVTEDDFGGVIEIYAEQGLSVRGS